MGAVRQTDTNTGAAEVAAPYTLRAPEYYARQFDGSRGLFRACWRWYRAALRGAIDNPRTDADAHG